MELNTFTNYEILYTNNYCYRISEDEFKEETISNHYNFTSDELIEFVYNIIKNNTLYEISIKNNEIYISHFNPMNGECDDITIKIKAIEEKK